MPIITVKLWDIERLFRNTIEFKELNEVLVNLKAEVSRAEGDTLEIEVSHDRADLFSAEGIGRALRYWYGVEEPKVINVSTSNEYSLHISKAPRYRPYALLAIVRNVRLDDEGIRQLFQFQEKLHITHCNDRAMVSIGLYDLDKVRPPIRYVSVNNASFKPLESTREMSLDEILKVTDKGIKYAHLVRKGEYPLLLDGEDKVLSFPPIINSEESRVTERTRNVLIDVTGTEPKVMAKVLMLVAFNVLERSYGRGSLELVPIQNNKSLNTVLINLSRFRELRINSEEVLKLLGIKIGINEITRSLQRLGYPVKNFSNDEVNVYVPPYRIDVLNNVDVIEDIAIGYGYERINVSTYPPTHYGEIDPLERFSEIIRELMIGLGFDEVINFMLIDAEYLRKLSEGEFIELLNPKLKSYSAVRNSLIPSLIMSIKINSEEHSSLRIFEIGDYVALINRRPVSVRALAFAIYADNITLTDGLVTVKSLLTMLSLDYTLREVRRKPFIEGRAASIIIGGKELGYVGEVHPEVLVDLGIVKPLVIGEFNLTEMLRLIRSD